MVRQWPTSALRLPVAILLCGATIVGWASAPGRAQEYDRRNYYSQPMGYSAWKPQPRSVEEFVEMLEKGRLNATPEQYAQALHEAGWIERAEVQEALQFLRSLREGVIRETRLYRMGRILRSYRTRAGRLDSHYHQVVRGGEKGYFESGGGLVIRGTCLNVVYPDRRVAVLSAREERPPEAPPAPPPPAAVPEAPRTDFAFDPPPVFPPPVRENQEPLSRFLP